MSPVIMLLAVWIKVAGVSVPAGQAIPPCLRKLHPTFLCTPAPTLIV